MKNASNFQDDPESNNDMPSNAPSQAGNHDKDSGASSPATTPTDNCAHCLNDPPPTFNTLPAASPCKGERLRRLNDNVISSAVSCRGALGESAIARVKRLAEDGLESSDCVEAVKDLQSLLFRQEVTLGKNHPLIAYTDMLTGLCHQHTRNFDSAMKSLRSAVVRFQQSDDIDEELFIECLCMMAAIYRESGKFDAARTTIKQAYRIIPESDAPLNLQARVLEELAGVLVAENQHKAAATAYHKLIRMHQQIADHQSYDLIHAWIGLSICEFTSHELDAAENALVQAIQIYFDTNKNDRYLMVQLLEKMGGVLRQKGQFLQADMVVERAHELLGRLDQMCGHAMYGELLDDAEAAERVGDMDLAKQRYRQALCAIESQRERRLADRIPILVRLFLMTTRKQNVQRTSLLSDIEDALREIFCGYPGEISDSLRRLSLIFRLLGRKTASEDLALLADELGCEMAALVSVDYKKIAKDNTESK